MQSTDTKKRKYDEIGDEIANVDTGVVLRDILDSYSISHFERMIRTKSNGKSSFENTHVFLDSFIDGKTPKWMLRFWSRSKDEVVCMCSLVLYANQVCGSNEGTRIRAQIEGCKHLNCTKTEVLHLSIDEKNICITRKQPKLSIVTTIGIVESREDIPPGIESESCYTVRFDCSFSSVDAAWSTLGPLKSNIVIEIRCDASGDCNLKFAAIENSAVKSEIAFSDKIQSTLTPGRTVRVELTNKHFEKLADMCKIKKSSKGLSIPFSAYIDETGGSFKVVCKDPGIDKSSVPLCMLFPAQSVAVSTPQKEPALLG
jgi:hypothetical protein